MTIWPIMEKENTFYLRGKTNGIFDVDRWFADRGDQTLRLDYDLNENSVVLDLGGYHGSLLRAFIISLNVKYMCSIIYPLL